MTDGSSILPASIFETKTVLRFWRYVEKTDTCWVWRGKLGGRRNTPQFYSGPRVPRKYYAPRRIAWELSGRPGLGPKTRLLTTCRNPLCVNPKHMQVSAGTMLAREVCFRKLHKMTEENVYVTTQGKRACRACMREAWRKKRERYSAEGRGWGRSYRAA